jgi:hypothetical protein
MAKRRFFLIVDTETTITDNVADFGAIVCDKQGNIHAECGVLVRDYYLEREEHPLFHNQDYTDTLWGKRSLEARYSRYDNMLTNGTRMLASKAGINSWLAKVNAKYSPVLTAYNLKFDLGKCRNSGIDLEMFKQSFCLWYAAANKWMKTREYRQFILDGHHFNAPTKFGNMSFQTKAEPMAAFVLGDHDMDPEPHTALEDARDYELPILKRLVATTSPKQYLNPTPVTWRDVQVRDWYTPK